MTAIIEENPTDDALYADEPATEAAAAAEPGPDDVTAAAPYGWTRDRATGLMRPKLAPGRPRAPRTPEELADEPEPPPRPHDEPPAQDRKPLPPTDDDVPMPAGGVIAKKVNRLYRRIGRALRKLDDEIGTAFLEVTRKEDPDDVTAGEAWENLAKDNPRIRAWILNAIKGGAWQDLIFAHGAIAMAIFTKRWILEHIPIIGMAASWFERDDDDGQAGDDDGQAEQLEPADVQAMADTSAAIMRRAGSNVTIKRMAAKLADGSASLEDLEHLDPELVAAAQSMAARGLPPGLRRQPQKRSRAKRRH